MTKETADNLYSSAVSADEDIAVTTKQREKEKTRVRGDFRALARLHGK